VRPDGMPILYCGILSLLLVPLFFISRRFRVRERLAAALIVLTLLASFSIKVLDLIWHGFQTPNWLNYRYSFMLIFLLVTFAARAFDGLGRRSARTVSMIGLCLIICIFLLQTFGIKYLHDFAGVYPDIGLIVLYCVLIALTVLPRRRVSPVLVRSLLSFLVIVELFVSALLNLVALDDDVVVSTRPSYLDFLNKWQPVVDEMRESETELFYRTEFLNRKRINDAYALGTYGLTGSTSTLNAKTIAFLSKMGIYAQSHSAQYNASSPLTDSLLSIKYIMLNSDSAARMPSLYEKVYDDGDAACYLNPDALPIAYAVDPSIKTITFVEPEEDSDDGRTYYSDTSPFEILNVTVRSMFGSDESLGIYTPIAVEKPELHNLNTYSVSGGHAYYTKKDMSEYASIAFQVTGDGEHEVYAFFPSRWFRSCYYYLNGKWGAWMFSGSTYGFINLGVIPADEPAEFKIYVYNDKGQAYIDKTVPSYFYYFDADAYREAVGELKDGGINLTSFREDRMAGTITVPEGRTAIFTTIPYDKGWNVRIDGKTVETYENLDALLGFDAPEGEHEIELNYMPSIYVTAAKLSITGAALFITVLAGELVCRIIRKNKEKRECTTTLREN